MILSFLPGRHLDIGETQLKLPEELGVKMSVSKFLFLTEVQIPTEFEKDGRYYYSRNYQNARCTCELRISQGIGALSFR